MISLVSVLEDSDRYVEPVRRVFCGNSLLSSFGPVHMDGVVVMPDDVVRSLYENMVMWGMHVVPDGRIGVGMDVGDVITVDDEVRVLSVDAAVAMCNAHMLHRARSFESLMVAWTERQALYHECVVQLVERVVSHDPNCFGHDVLQDVSAWNRSCVGSIYVSCPNKTFVEALRAVSGELDPDDLQAADLARDIQRWCDGVESFAALPERLFELRHAVGHKGIPEIVGSYFTLTSPAASGGASWHSVTPAYALDGALPNMSSLVMVAGQTDQAVFRHIGGGNIKGAHYTFSMPDSEFFTRVWGDVSKDTRLCDVWHDVRDDVGMIGLVRWMNEIVSIKQQHLARLMDDVLGGVMGFFVDLNNPKVVSLRPMVTASHYDEHAQVLSGDLVIDRHEFGGLGVKIGGYTYDMSSPNLTWTDKYNGFLPSSVED